MFGSSQDQVFWHPSGLRLRALDLGFRVWRRFLGSPEKHQQNEVNYVQQEPSMRSSKTLKTAQDTL